MSESRHLPHHQRSSSTGSHGLFFNSSIQHHHQLTHGVNPLHHHQAMGHLHGAAGVGQPHHHVLHHQGSGSPDLLSELSDDDEGLNEYLNGSNSAPELQGMSSYVKIKGTLKI